MKYLLVLLLLSAKSYGQLISLPEQDGKVYYKKVYEDSATKEQLFERAKDVFIRLFPDTKSVIQDQDREAGTITGKGYFQFDIKGGAFNSTFPQMVECTFRITTKDNKYRVEIFDFNSVATDSREYPLETGYYIVANKKQKKWYKYYDQFNTTVIGLFDQISQQMDKKQNEW